MGAQTIMACFLVPIINLFADLLSAVTKFATITVAVRGPLSGPLGGPLSGPLSGPPRTQPQAPGLWADRSRPALNNPEPLNPQP